jgi:uncharacterized protein YndB with AHSA1/START domain
VNELSAALETIDGKPVLRFERKLAHSPTKVWRAITQPGELAAWFPAAVETDLKPGAAMRFTFPDGAPVDETGQGEVLEVDPPKVFAFRWNTDVLRFELVPDGDGCVLRFTQVLGGGPFGRLSAGRNAVGWDVCLAALEAHLEGREFTQPTEWPAPMEAYIHKFGLDEGSVEEAPDGYRVRFARDLVWKPLEDVWALLVDDTSPAVGDEPPARATNAHVPAGRVTAGEPPRLLEYATADGHVRWEFTRDPATGTRVELTHTAQATADLPTVLAAWHVHLELFFAATFGEIRPWPEDRFEELRKHYADAR